MTPEKEDLCCQWGELFERAGLPKTGIAEVIQDRLPHLVRKDRLEINVDDAFRRFTHRWGKRFEPPDSYWANILVELIAVFSPPLRDEAEALRIKTVSVRRKARSRKLEPERLIYQFDALKELDWLVHGFSTSALGSMYGGTSSDSTLQSRLRFARTLSLDEKRLKRELEFVDEPSLNSKFAPHFPDQEFEMDLRAGRYGKVRPLCEPEFQWNFAGSDFVLVRDQIIELTRDRRVILHGALLTRPNTAFFQLLNDQVPVLLVNSSKQQVALLSVGLETAVKPLFEDLATRMEMGVEPENQEITAYIGPCIQRESLVLHQGEVDRMLLDGRIRWDIDPFSYSFNSRPNDCHIDLVGFIRHALNDCGATRKVVLSGIDTYVSQEFYSARRAKREGTPIECFGCIIGIRPTCVDEGTGSGDPKFSSK